MPKTRGLVVVVLSALVLVGAWWYGRRAPQPLPPDAGSIAVETSSPAEVLTIHVSGEVVAPGLVTLPQGARVADALAAAGGATSQAELGSVNLAAAVHDGAQIVVPGRNTPGQAPAAAAPPAGVDESGRVRINVAGQGELERLPGVGPVLTARILRHREENGPFSRVEDLLDVPGIGEGKLAALRDSVAVP